MKLKLNLLAVLFILVQSQMSMADAPIVISDPDRIAIHLNRLFPPESTTTGTFYTVSATMTFFYAQAVSTIGKCLSYNPAFLSNFNANLRTYYVVHRNEQDFTAVRLRNLPPRSSAAIGFELSSTNVDLVLVCNGCTTATDILTEYESSQDH